MIRKRFWAALAIAAVVIAIAGTVAVNMYSDARVERAQLAEAILLMNTLKAPLTEYFSRRKKWPKKLEEVSARTSGQYTASVAITKGAGGSSGDIELTATMRTEGIRSSIAGKVVRMVSSDGGNSWQCQAGSAPSGNLPVACRN